MLEKIKKLDKKPEKPLKPPFVSFFLYLLCFIPYLLLLNASISGVSFGFFGVSHRYFGYEAVVLQALVLICIPVLPAAALYQLIFLIVTRKRRSLAQKITGLALFLSIAGALFLSCTLYRVRTEKHFDQVYHQDKETIEAYLKTEFGEEYAAQMEVLKPYEESPYYQVKTPIMDSTFLVCLDEEHQTVESCYFCESYQKDRDLPTLLYQKLARTYGIPDNVGLWLDIHGFPFQAPFEQNTDQLLDSCDFELLCVYLNSDNYDREEVLEEIRRFYTGYGKHLLPYRKQSFLYFYAIIDGKQCARIEASLSPDDPDICCLNFTGYKDDNGVLSIPRESLEISLKP